MKGKDLWSRIEKLNIQPIEETQELLALTKKSWEVDMPKEDLIRSKELVNILLELVNKKLNPPEQVSSEK